MRALDEGAQVVLAGRSSDPAPLAARAMRAQLAAGAGLVRRQDAGMRRRAGAAEGAGLPAT